MEWDEGHQQERSYSLPRGVIAAIAVSVAWIVISASYLAQTHQVPSLVDYKAAYVNYSACGGQDAGMAGQQVQDCLEQSHQHLLSAWKKDVGAVVAMPPLLAWAGIGGVLALRWRRRLHDLPL